MSVPLPGSKPGALPLGEATLLCFSDRTAAIRISNNLFPMGGQSTQTIDCLQNRQRDFEQINCRRWIRTTSLKGMNLARFRFSILRCTCLEEPFQHVHLLTTRGSRYITDKQHVFGTRLYIPTHCPVLFPSPNFQSPNNGKDRN